MSSVRISLLGKLRIEVDESDGPYEVELQPRRARELLCYILVHSDALHEREKLASLMWPENTTAHSKRYLRQTLWQVQSAMNHRAQPDGQLLLVDHNRIGINPSADYWLDITVFESAFAAVVDKPGGDLTADQAESIQRAVQLYRGDLLEGWYQDWCSVERERYQIIYLALLDKLLSFSEAHQAYETGVAYGMQILRYDRAREQTHRRLMRLHHLAGDRSAAIQQYRSCVQALREELNVDPAKSTVALYEQIRGGQVAPHTSAAERDPEPGPDEAGAVDTLRQLELIQSVLGQLQAQVGQLMQAIQQQEEAQH